MSKFVREYPITAAMSYSISQYIATNFFPDLFPKARVEPFVTSVPITQAERKPLLRLERALETMGFNASDLVAIMNHIASKYYAPLCA